MAIEGGVGIAPVGVRFTTPSVTAPKKPKPSSGGSNSGGGGSSYSRPAARPKYTPTPEAIDRRVNGGNKQQNNNGGGNKKPLKAMGGDGVPDNLSKLKAPKAPVAPVAKPLPTFDQWAMKDSQYQQALAQYNAQASSLATNRDSAISTANQDRTNQLSDWQTQYERGDQALFDDFAARGLGNSGLYADANTKYDADQEAVQQSIINAIMARINGANKQYEVDNTSNELAKQQAKNNAATRGAGMFTGVAK